MSGNSSMDNPFFGVPFRELESMKVFIYYDDAGDAIAYTLLSIDTFMRNRFVTVIHSSVRIASAVIVGVILALIARTYKSLMFCLYELNMVLMLIAAVLEIAFMFTSGGSLTLDITGGAATNPSAHLGFAATVFPMLLVYSLLGSLVTQIYVAHGDQRRLFQWGITIVAMVGCFPTVFIWLWRCVLIGINDSNPAAAALTWNPDHQRGAWTHRGAWPAFAASSSFCSLILCLKLWQVQRNRAKLGLNHYDPVKIIFVMAVQNSVIPAILAIIGAGLGTKSFGGASISAAAVVVTAILLPTGYLLAQFEILKGSQSQGRPIRIQNVDIEKAKSFAHSQTDTYTGATTDTGELASRCTDEGGVTIEYHN